MHHHYDLLAREGWTATSVLIVSPYVEPQFFKRVVKDLAPTSLTVVVDDGCRPEDISMIKGLRRRGLQVQAALAGTRGLVHAKIFYVEWLTPGGQRAHTLIYGSGNATRQAFDGDFNSELMCKARLSAAQHGEILEWIGAVRAAAGAPRENRFIDAVRDVWLADGVHIRLPGMTIRDATAKASNFDLWLQRGRLISAFRADPSFLRVHVNLLQPLPAGAVAQTVQDIGFAMAKTQRLSIAYIASRSPDLDDNAEHGNWRSRLCVWTQLGDWSSEACYLANSDAFRKAGYEDRENDLKQLEALGDERHRGTARNEFLAHVERLWNALGNEAGTYLKAAGGQVNREFYSGSFDERIERDQELAADQEFKDRYVKGFEVIDVPRFRLDALAWKGFVRSFARQMHLEWLKRRSQSLIFHQIRDALDDEENAFETETLVETLRSKWNTIIESDDGPVTFGQFVDGYQNNF